MEKDQLFYLENRKQVMIMYLNMKVREEDWHGVADAANDLREIEAQIEILKEMLDRPSDKD